MAWIGNRVGRRHWLKGAAAVGLSLGCPVLVSDRSWCELDVADIDIRCIR